MSIYSTTVQFVISFTAQVEQLYWPMMFFFSWFPFHIFFVMLMHDREKQKSDCFWAAWEWQRMTDNAGSDLWYSSGIEEHKGGYDM